MALNWLSSLLPKRQEEQIDEKRADYNAERKLHAAARNSFPREFPRNLNHFNQIYNETKLLQVLGNWDILLFHVFLCFFCESDGGFCKLPGSRSKHYFISFFFFLYIAFIYRLRLAGPKHDEKEALWRFVLRQRSRHVFLARSSGSSRTRSDIFSLSKLGFGSSNLQIFDL